MLHLSKFPTYGAHVTDICYISYCATLQKYNKCLFYLLWCIHLMCERQIYLKLVHYPFKPHDTSFYIYKGILKGLQWLRNGWYVSFKLLHQSVSLSVSLSFRLKNIWYQYVVKRNWYIIRIVPICDWVFRTFLYFHFSVFLYFYLSVFLSSCLSVNLGHLGSSDVDSDQSVLMI